MNASATAMKVSSAWSRKSRIRGIRELTNPVVD